MTLFLKLLKLMSNPHSELCISQYKLRKNDFYLSKEEECESVEGQDFSGRSLWSSSRIKSGQEPIIGPDNIGYYRFLYLDKISDIPSGILYKCCKCT
jgi:hypothetical protein